MFSYVRFRLRDARLKLHDVSYLGLVTSDNGLMKSVGGEIHDVTRVTLGGVQPWTAATSSMPDRALSPADSGQGHPMTTVMHRTGSRSAHLCIFIRP